MANDNKGINPVEAGLVGAVVGAAAGAAAIALSDKKTRKRVETKIGELRKEGEKRLDQMKEVASELRLEAQKFTGQTGKKKVKALKKGKSV